MDAARLRIMIVDDDPAHAEAIRRALEYSGTVDGIRVAGTLQEFRAAVAGNPPDIALVDLNLPDGRAVEILSSPPESGPFPILIMTSYGNEQTAVEALKNGALDYLVKSPAAFAEIPRTVARSLREWKLLRERKNAEEALRESNRRLQLATSSASLGIWDWDIADDRLLLDELTLALYGITSDTFSGRMDAWEKALHHDDRLRVMSALQTALPNSRNIDTEYRIVRPDGSTRHIKSNAIIIRDTDGAAVRMIGLNQDVTDQKTLEEQLRQSQKMEAIGLLAGGIAHDFNNILTVIYGYGSMIRMKVSRESACSSDIDEVLSAAERAANLTRSLLAFSRKQVMSPTMINLNDVVTNVGKLLTRVIGEDIQLRTAFGTDALMVCADRSQIEQVLLNLATNARDAMPNGGVFSIETQTREIDESFIHTHGYGMPGRYAALSVSDSGLGMNAETLKNIFDPFFTTKEAGKGTGLGLSIVYGVVKQHNGYINVTSEPDRGCTFSILIPLADEAAAEPAAEKNADLPASGTETVLVAEDDAAIRQFAGLILKKFGYDVILAHDGNDAVAKFRANSGKIGIVVLDMIMPGKNGKEAYEEISRIHPGTKVIFMSGYSPDLLTNKGIFASSDKILAKPVQPLDFVRKVRQILDSSPLET